jgi:ADP-heptose:LPS heptosyltransferase
MCLAALTYDQNIRLTGYRFKANRPYLFDKKFANNFLKSQSTIPKIENIHPSKIFDKTLNWNNKNLLVLRHGGFGDLLFLTPIFAELKKRWKRIKIYACCSDQYHQVLISNQDITGIIKFPIELSKANTFDAIINFSYSNENEKANPETHIVDLFSNIINLNVSDKRIKLTVPHSEREKARIRYPKTSIHRIGIQVFASNEIRSYPFFQTQKLINEFWNRGYEIFLFGSQDQIPFNDKERIINLTIKNPSPTFMESAAIMYSCDLFIAPDSSLCHVAGALNIPTIGIYGSFPSKVRTAYADSIYAIDGKNHCAPCFHHTLMGLRFPKDMPCEKSGFCDTLANIDPIVIFNIAMSLL